MIRWRNACRVLRNRPCFVSYTSKSDYFYNRQDKNSDALRAIGEYLQKQDISDLALANLHKIYAVLLMISNEYQNSILALNYFKKAIEHYTNCSCKNKGIALCKLGIAKVWHDRMEELVNDSPDITENNFVNKLLMLVSTAKEIFEKYGDQSALYQWQMIQNSILPKSDVGGEKRIELENYSAIMDEHNDILLGKFNIN